jgi:uncharacterized protein YbaP (TraB family)
MNETGQMEKGVPDGLDKTFELQARRDKKKVRRLDDSSVNNTAILVMDEMLASWKRSIEKKGVDAVVEEALADKPEEDQRGWRFGDMKAVEAEQEEIKEESAVLYEQGIVERNKKWMVKLRKVLEKKEDTMVMVGIDHLGGSDGLLRALTEEGYKVEQLYGVDRPGK